MRLTMTLTVAVKVISFVLLEVVWYSVLNLFSMLRSYKLFQYSSCLVGAQNAV